MKIPIQREHSAFDACEKKAGVCGGLDWCRGGGPLAFGQLRHQPVLARSERFSVGIPEQQLAAAVKHQDPRFCAVFGRQENR